MESQCFGYSQDFPERMYREGQIREVNILDYWRSRFFAEMQPRSNKNLNICFVVVSLSRICTEYQSMSDLLKHKRKSVGTMERPVEIN